MLHQLIDFQGNRSGVIATLTAIPNSAGGGAGEAVAVPVTYNPYSGDGVTPMLPNGLPAGYVVFVNPSQPCFATISDQTSSSFTVTLTPPAGVTLAEGTFDAAIVG